MILYPEIERPALKDIPAYYLGIKYRGAELVSDRVRFAKKMRKKGYTLKQIGSMMNRHHSTIVHYLHHYNDR